MIYEVAENDDLLNILRQAFMLAGSTAPRPMDDLIDTFLLQFFANISQTIRAKYKYCHDCLLSRRLQNGKFRFVISYISYMFSSFIYSNCTAADCQGI